MPLFSQFVIFRTKRSLLQFYLDKWCFVQISFLAAVPKSAVSARVVVIRIAGAEPRDQQLLHALLRKIVD
jgi:hypothetical protein